MISTVAQISLIFTSLQMMQVYFIEIKLFQNEKQTNAELDNIHVWLSANGLSLNIEKSNFIIFYPPQNKLQTRNFNLAINIS